jgi:hypothetical protein
MNGGAGQPLFVSSANRPTENLQVARLGTRKLPIHHLYMPDGTVKIEFLALAVSRCIDFSGLITGCIAWSL